jgi:hypothetical protein
MPSGLIIDGLRSCRTPVTQLRAVNSKARGSTLAVALHMRRTAMISFMAAKPLRHLGRQLQPLGSNRNFRNNGGAARH